MEYKYEILESIDYADIHYNFHDEDLRPDLKEELNEVYRKAEAFDEIKDYLSRPSPIDEDRDEVQKIIDEYDKDVK